MHYYEGTGRAVLLLKEALSAAQRDKLSSYGVKGAEDEAYGEAGVQHPESVIHGGFKGSVIGAGIGGFLSTKVKPVTINNLEKGMEIGGTIGGASGAMYAHRKYKEGVAAQKKSKKKKRAKKS